MTRLSVCLFGRRRRPFRRYAGFGVNPAESRGDAAARAPLRTKTAEAAMHSRGCRGPNSGISSSSGLFAKATYKNFEDMLEKEPGAILVDFYATCVELLKSFEGLTCLLLVEVQH